LVNLQSLSAVWSQPFGIQRTQNCPVDICLVWVFSVARVDGLNCVRYLFW